MSAMWPGCSGGAPQIPVDNAPGSYEAGRGFLLVLTAPFFSEEVSSMTSVWSRSCSE